jgi:hypothetical protein
MILVRLPWVFHHMETFHPVIDNRKRAWIIILSGIIANVILALSPHLASFLKTHVNVIGVMRRASRIQTHSLCFVEGLYTVIAINTKLFKLWHCKRILMPSFFLVMFGFQCSYAAFSLPQLMVSICFEHTVELPRRVCASWGWVIVHITFRNLNWATNRKIVALPHISGRHREILLMVAGSFLVFLRYLLQALNAVLIEPIDWILAAGLMSGWRDWWEVFWVEHAVISIYLFLLDYPAI